MNSDDSDGGVLVGLWSANEDDYKDGTDPTAWSGSSAILEEFMETKKGIKYAQCWVFGGILTTGERPFLLMLSDETILWVMSVITESY